METDLSKIMSHVGFGLDMLSVQKLHTLREGKSLSRFVRENIVLPFLEDDKNMTNL